MANRAGGVVDRDPTPNLLAAAEPAGEPEAKQGQHLPQCAAAGAEDDPEAEVHHAHAGSAGRLGCFLPLARHVRQEPLAGQLLLGEPFGPPVAVVAHGRGASEDLRRPLEAGDRPGEQARRDHAAVAYPLPPLGRPPARGNALAPQVDHRVGPFQVGRIEAAGVGVPLDRLWRRAGRAADQPANAVARVFQERQKRRADEARRAGNHDGLHGALGIVRGSSGPVKRTGRGWAAACPNHPSKRISA